MVNKNEKLSTDSATNKDVWSVKEHKLHVTFAANNYIV